MTRVGGKREAEETEGEEEVEEGRQTADEGTLCFYDLSERYKCSPNEAQDAKDDP